MSSFIQTLKPIHMHISLASPSDLDGVFSMVMHCIHDMESRGIHQWDELYPTREIFQEDIAKHTLFMMVDSEIVGVMALNNVQDPEYKDVSWNYIGERILVVHRLCVHPDSQGKGVASNLMEFAENLGRNDGYVAIRLDAFTQNPAAVSLYENRGYRKAGTVKFRKGLFFCFEKCIEKSKISGNVA